MFCDERATMMPERRTSEIFFSCPEALYQALVRELSKSAGRPAASIERDFARVIEKLLTRLVARRELLADLVRPTPRVPRRKAVRPKRPPATVTGRAKSKRKTAQR